MGLKLIFLIVSRVMSLLGLSRREAWWKDAEILMLRHELSVAVRERPQAPTRLTWPDRAWLALLAGTLPVECLAAMRLIVTPGTILRCTDKVLGKDRALSAPRVGAWAGHNATSAPSGGRRCRGASDRMLILNQAHLRAVLAEYQTHYNTARPHQGIDQQVPGCDRGVPSVIEVNLDARRIHRRPVLSGLINEYSRAA